MSHTLYAPIRSSVPMVPARVLFRLEPTRPPDVFLKVPPVKHSRRGGAHVAAMHRAKNVLARLGL